MIQIVTADGVSEQRLIASLHGLAHIPRRNLAGHFIAAHADEANRVEDINPVNMPLQPRMIVNCLHNAPRRRWRRDVIGNSLYLQLRTAE